MTDSKTILHDTTISPHEVVLPMDAEYVLGTGDWESVVGPFHGLAEVEHYCRQELGIAPGSDLDVIKAYEQNRGMGSVMPLFGAVGSRDATEVDAGSDQYVIAFCDSAAGPFSGLAEVRQYCRERLIETTLDDEDSDDEPRDWVKNPDDVEDAFSEVFEGYRLRFRELPPGWRD